MSKLKTATDRQDTLVHFPHKCVIGDDTLRAAHCVIDHRHMVLKCSTYEWPLHNGCAGLNET